MDARTNKTSGIGESPLRRKPQEFIATFFIGVAVRLEEYLKTRGQDGRSVLQAAGLKRQHLNERYTRFPIQQLATAFEISEQQTEDPLFGLHFGEWYTPTILIAGQYAISTAPDLREALNALKDYRSLVVGIPVQLSDQGAFTELSWILESASFYPRHIIDFIAMRTLEHIQQATGPDWRPLRVNLTYEKPENVDEHFRILGPNVHFDQAENSIRIDSDALAMPMPDANPDIYHMALNNVRNPFACEQEDKDLVDRLRRFISAQLDKNDISLKTAAEHMGMTPQQLRRQLKKHGTCFRCVLDETRKSLAAHYLFETETRFSEITYLLGFSDQSTFTRSARRWFGTTPKDMRRNSS